MRRIMIALLIAAGLALGVTQASAGEIGQLGPTGPDRGRECVHFYVQIAQQEDVPHGVGHKIRWACTGRVFPHIREFTFR